MSESINSFVSFIEEIKITGESIILYAIPRDIFIHPAIQQASLVFIKAVKSKKIVSISYNQQDDVNIIKVKEFVSIITSLSNIKWVFNKKEFMQMFGVSKLNDIDLYLHLWEGKIIEREKAETVAHKFIYRSKRNFKNLNDVVPLLKHKEMFNNMCDCFSDKYPIDDGYKKENELIIETLSDLETNGVYVNSDCFKNHFNATIHENNLVYSQYHIYTSTGRPSNNFDNVNYAALNKDNGSRECFVSRFGENGKMVLIDYSAFHPRIICGLIDFPLSVDIDIYKYLGEMYFKRPVNDSDVAEIKKITFRQLFGGVEEQYEHIKYFSRLKSYIKTNWENFQRDGFVLTPVFGRRITDKHILDPNPNKLFNYILQATETEIAVPTLSLVNSYLKDKQTKAILYTYDSILFDFNKTDGSAVLTDIISIMKMNNRFSVKVDMGDSYASLSQIYPQF